MRRVFVLVSKAWLLYRANGIEVLARRVWRYVRRRGIRGILLDLDNSERFQQWLRVHAPSQEELNRMGVEALSLTYAPMIDVIMPVCDPELPWLEAAVRSVRDQVYPHWHLCIADDASRRPAIRDFLDRIATEDPRVSVVRRAVRGGISAATNTALSCMKGEFACFLDHDDELTPHALHRVVKVLNEYPALDLIYSDECAMEGNGRLTDPHFKPSFSPDLLMSMNYIGHLVVCRTELLKHSSGVRSEFDGSQDYDLLLRLSELTSQVGNIPDILYHWRRVPGSSSLGMEAKPYADRAATRALEDATIRRGLRANVSVVGPGRYRVHCIIHGEPLVSIIIPTRNRRDLLERCIASIENRTSYQTYEIIVMNNESDDRSALEFLRSLGSDPKCRVANAEGTFNWSKLNNTGVELAKGEYLLFLNNDTEVISPTWLDELVSQGQHPQIGAVGAKLLFPDGRIQHAGVVVKRDTVATHMFRGMDARANNAVNRYLTEVTRDVSAVTGACLGTRREVFEGVGGFREELRISYGDVDYCLRLQQQGYRVVWTPYARLLHHESATRGDTQPNEDEKLFTTLWRERAEDPFLSEHLEAEDGTVHIKV